MCVCGVCGMYAELQYTVIEKDISPYQFDVSSPIPNRVNAGDRYASDLPIDLTIHSARTEAGAQEGN